MILGITLMFKEIITYIMTKSVVTMSLKEQAMEMAGGENADDAVVQALLGMTSKKLVEWMNQKRAEASTGGQSRKEDDSYDGINRWSTFNELREE